MPDDAPLMLSISGLRGIVGASLTPDLAARYAAAIGCHFRHTTDQPAPRVVVGRDSRSSGQSVQAAVVAGLTAAGCRVTTVGILTTPGVAIAVGRLDAAGGIVITASHNPAQWNGIKTLRHDGLAPPPDQAQAIIDRFRNDQIDWVDVDGYQPVEDFADAAAVHVDAVLAHVDVQAIQKKKLRVVLDSVHGAGGPETAMLFEKLGIDCVHLYAEPTGRFPHPPEPTREHLAGLCDAVTEHGVAVGFAQDPDADRLAIVDDRGRYIGEEYTLALAARHVFAHKLDTLGAPALTAANLSTSRMVDDIAADHGGRVVRTPVGEANVAAAMAQHDIAIGGEGNGGVIYAPVSHVRDSLVGIALTLEMLALTDQPLSKIVDDLPRYAIVKTKHPIAPGMADAAASALRHAYADQRIDEADGIRIDWPDRWLHVRPSNTEPILRLIAEAPTHAEAQALIDAAAKHIS